MEKGSGAVNMKVEKFLLERLIDYKDVRFMNLQNMRFAIMWFGTILTENGEKKIVERNAVIPISCFAPTGQTLAIVSVNRKSSLPRK